MENKYYTPEIEDLCVGYEGEYRVGRLYDWNRFKIVDLHTDSDGMGTYEFEYSLKEGNLRTPFLTKEQIEAEGWVFNNKYGCYNKEKNLESGYSLIPQPLKKIIIQNTGGCIFYGECKSINEFRKLIKWLEI